MRKSESEREPERQPGAVPTAPTAPVVSVEEFLLTHEAGRDIELKGGFHYWAQKHGWTKASRPEWVERYQAFRTREV